MTRLLEENALRGVQPDGWSAAARRERACDIPYLVEARFAKALDR